MSSQPPLPATDETSAFHAETPTAVATALNVDPATGLEPTEAAARLVRHGANQLASKAPRPAWLKFLDQFRDFLVIVLLGAAILAGAAHGARPASAGCALGPAQAVFDTVDLGIQDWAIAVALAASVLLLEEARKLLLRLSRLNN